MTRACRWLLVVAFGLACGRAASSPPQGTAPGTGAVATVVPSETDARVSRVEELLRGVPGLEVTALSNGSYQIRIRGHRSIRGNPGDDDPLIVIDGVPSTAGAAALADIAPNDVARCRSEEHTSELQSRLHLVCRLLLEKKKKNKMTKFYYISPPSTIISIIFVVY